jgi:hypothetical protein
MVPFENQTFVQQDLTGLLTMWKQQRVKLIEIDGMKHGDWLRNETVFAKNIAPLLAR